MAFVLADRVQETSTTTGTGTITLAGAVSGYTSFATVGNGNSCYYTITDGTNWEVGIGTYTALLTTLSRTTVLASSNAGSLVSFPAGTKNVFVTYPAGKSVFQDSAGTVSVPALQTSSTTSTTPVLSFNAANSAFASGATISGSYLQFLLQNKSTSAGASTNYVLSNDLGTDSTYYGEFGMNSSIFSATTPADFFSINNGIYFSGHDGDIIVGPGNGFKYYLAWGTTGQSAHVINASGAIGLNTNLGLTPALSGTTNFGTSGQVLTSAGSAASPTWTTPTTGTVTSVAQSFTGGLISVAGSPVTASGTLALTVAGTSGGIPYFSGASTWASSAALAASSLVIGGGAGVAPSTITTGTGVTTALGVNTGTAGAFVVNGGVLGTPSSGTVTNLTGTASININGTVGATTASTGRFTTVTSTIATGTAPFTVTSTTAVANLSIGGNAGTATTATNQSGGTVSATTLAASSTVSGTGFTNYFASPPALGGTAPAAVTGTSVTATTGGVTANSGGPFFLNATTVSANFTSPANFNLMSAGPITINTGITVTIDTTGTWVIV